MNEKQFLISLIRAMQHDDLAQHYIDVIIKRIEFLNNETNEIAKTVLDIKEQKENKSNLP